MDADMLREAIELAGGPEFIVGFYYDNNGRTLFVDEPFEMSMIQGNFVVIPGEDIYGVKTNTYKPMDVIQTILTVQDANDRTKIDKFFNRS